MQPPNTTRLHLMPCVTVRHQSITILFLTVGRIPQARAALLFLFMLSTNLKTPPLTSTAKLPSMAKNTKPTTKQHAAIRPAPKAACTPHAGGVMPAQERAGEQLMTYV